MVAPADYAYLSTAVAGSVVVLLVLGVPFTYWGVGGIKPGRYAEAVRNGTVSRDIPVNHSPGVSAMTVAALAWLGT
ncbi:hypothetical protein ACH3WN_07355 [Streptomyces albogriseolus]|uniref:hypothetical protein n=1 Tax=Streptomyces albogriseolus TaxID=1887 RepID=UPI00378DABD2